MDLYDTSPKNFWMEGWVIIHENKTESGEVISPFKRDSLLTFGAFLCVWSCVVSVVVIALLIRTSIYTVKTANSASFVASQLMLGAIVVSLTVVTEYKKYWALGAATCRVWLTLQVFIIALSSWSLLMITLTNAAGVFFPRSMQASGRKLAVASPVFSILAAAAAAVRPGILVTHPEGVLDEVCAARMTQDYALTVSLPAYIVPGALSFIVMVTTLIRLACLKTRRYKQRYLIYSKTDAPKSSELLVAGYSRCPTELAGSPDGTQRDESSGTTVVVLINLFYLVLWMPFHVANIVVTFCDGFCLEPSLWSLFIWLGYSSAGVLPLFFLLSREIRSALRLKICRKT